MEELATSAYRVGGAGLPASSYPYHHRIFKSATSGPATGLLFDMPSCAIMSIVHPPASETPDMNADTEGDRILALIDGDLALQIGEHRFILTPGDALRIPRGVRFGNASSTAGAHVLLIRAKNVRSFSLHR